MLLFSWMSAVTYIFYFIILVRTVSSRLRKKLAEIYGYFFGKWNKLYSGRHNRPNGACSNKIKNAGYWKTFPLGRRWINNQRKSNSVWYNALYNLVPRGRDPFGQKTGIATSGQVQHWKSAIHGLPVTLCMPRVKSYKSDWFWSQSIVFRKLFETGMSLDLARSLDFQRMTKGTPGDEVARCIEK